MQLQPWSSGILYELVRSSHGFCHNKPAYRPSFDLTHLPLRGSLWFQFQFQPMVAGGGRRDDQAVSFGACGDDQMAPQEDSYFASRNPPHRNR
jgi:hypothetical protein